MGKPSKIKQMIDFILMKSNKKARPAKAAPVELQVTEVQTNAVKITWTPKN